MTILWRDQMSVGNDLIDQDHRYLICLINSIELALRHEDTFDALLTLLDQLASYTKFHFEREERIQKKCQYPLHESHRHAHEEIIKKLLSLRADIRKSASDGTAIQNLKEGQALQNIIALLKSWIVEHVLVDDKRMEYYLKKLPPNFE
jgi:hemerythrin